MVGLSPQAKFGKTLIVGEGKKFKVNRAQEQQSYFALRWPTRAGARSSQPGSAASQAVQPARQCSQPGSAWWKHVGNFLSQYWELWVVCLKRDFGKIRKLRFRQTMLKISLCLLQLISQSNIKPLPTCGLSETQFAKIPDLRFRQTRTWFRWNAISDFFRICVSDKPHVGKGLILLRLISWRRHRGKISKSNIRFRPTLT